MQLSSASPVTALRNYVRCFQQRDAHVGEATITFPIAARPEQFLEFYLKQRYLVHSCETGLRDLCRCRRGRAMYLSNSLSWCYTAVLTCLPSTFSLPDFINCLALLMPKLADRACDARSVVGPAISEIEERLADASNFGERVDVATGFRPACHPRNLAQCGGGCSQPRD